MKCLYIRSPKSVSPTYRNIEESLNQAIMNRSTVLIDNEQLYHEIAGDLFINNITLDVRLVRYDKPYKFEYINDVEYGEDANVMLITNHLNSYSITGVKCHQHKKDYLIIKRGAKNVQPIPILL